jgi:hypothetical protein
MALIDAVFRRPAHNRTMTFAEIASETRLPVEEVEHLLMKGMRWATSTALFNSGSWTDDNILSPPNA